MPGDRRIGLELGQGALEHVDVDDRGWPEAAPLYEDGLLPQSFTGLQHLPVRPKHGDPAEAELYQLQGHQAVVDAPEFDTPKLDHVDLDAAGREPVEQALDERLRLVVLKERTMEQIDPDDADRLLLQRRLD